jgi:hypothetical protein
VIAGSEWPNLAATTCSRHASQQGQRRRGVPQIVQPDAGSPVAVTVRMNRPETLSGLSGAPSWSVNTYGLGSYPVPDVRVVADQDPARDRMLPREFSCGPPPIRSRRKRCPMRRRSRQWTRWRVSMLEAGTGQASASRRGALRWVSFGALLVLVGTALTVAEAQVPTSPLREREFVGGAAWSWFGDPRAVYHAAAHRRSYIGWDAPDGSIQVASYDHDTGQQVIATLKTRFQVDDHDTPSILVLPDARLMVFWSAHAGPQMYYRTSLRPEDVTAWGPEHTLPTNTAGSFGYTYPNPVQLTAEQNRIYLFWRGGNFNPTMSTSTNNGTSWSAARTLISNPGQRPYVKYASNDRDTIAMAFTEAHPRDIQTSIYFAEYRAGALRRADGSTIASMAALPIMPAAAEKVYDARATGVKAWVHDVALDATGHPVIVYATFPTDTDHRYHYARWDGSRWNDQELTRAGGSMSVDPAEPDYSGGITLDHEDPSTVYLSRQINGVFEVEVWRTSDGGATWTSSPLTANSVRGNYRPISPRGQRNEDLDVVWMHGGYPSYLGFQTGLRTQLHTRDIADPSIASWAQGRLDLFARDAQTGELIQKYFSNGWSEWRSFGLMPGGHALGPPTVSSWAPGRLDVFATDSTTGRLMQLTFDNGWRGWVDRGLGPGGHRVSSPAAVSWAEGRIDVVARDEVTNALVHWWQSGSTWSGPQVLTGGPGGSFVPSISSWSARRLDVFAVTPSGSLTQFWFDGTRWNGWSNKGRGPGGLALSARSAVDGRKLGRLDVLALAQDGRSLVHWWFDGHWLGPQDLGTGPDRIGLTGLGVTSWDSARLDVVSVDATRHSLVEDIFSGRWIGPLHLDFATSSAAASALGAESAAGVVSVMADPAPRAKPIPVDAKARAAD